MNSMKTDSGTSSAVHMENMKTKKTVTGSTVTILLYKIQKRGGAKQ